MPFIFSPIQPTLWKVSLTAVLDILLVAFLIYQFFMLIRGRRAAQVLVGVGVFVAVYALSILAGLELLRSILAMIVPYTGFALIVLFQSEIRRALIRIGRRRWLGFGGRLERLESADEILLALGKLTQQSIGALIVLERDTGLRTFIESGVRLDAHISRDLLLSIFKPRGELHDGAVIVQKDKVAAAACFLPLSMNPVLSTQLGTRHRAGIGITEETDAIAVIVSEETGYISLAVAGNIERDLTVEYLRERLSELLRRYVPPTTLPTPIEGGGPERALTPPKLDRAGDHSPSPGD